MKNIKENTIVFRGVKNCYFSSEIGIGSKFYFGEFISTTLNKKLATLILGNKGTLMTIILKNNGNNNYCCSLKEISVYPDEEEVIITSHCSYIVTDITKEGEIDYVNLICEGFLLD